MTLPVAILAGGLATRLGPIAENVPKVLVDVDGRPFAEHQLEFLHEQGIRDVVYCVGHLAEAIQSRLGDGQRWAMRFRYVSDGDRRLGTGGAIRNALSLLGPAFFVMYGDSYLECDFAAVADTFHASGCAALMTVFENSGRFDRSNVHFADGLVCRYDKINPTPEMHHIDYGLGVFSADAFSSYPEGSAFDLSRVYQDLLANARLSAYEVKTRFYEIGSPAGLAETRAYLAHRHEMTS